LRTQLLLVAVEQAVPLIQLRQTVFAWVAEVLPQAAQQVWAEELWAPPLLHHPVAMLATLLSARMSV
jgi:hypothetical protein